MIKITESEFLANIEHFLDLAGDGQDVLIIREDNKNLVIMNESKFNIES